MADLLDIRISSSNDPDLSSVDIDKETFSRYFSNPYLKCRLCLKSKTDMQQLSQIHWRKSGVSELFEKLTSIPMEFSTDYSQNICKDCENNLNVASAIRDEFVRVHRLWKIYLETYKDGPAAFEAIYFDIQPDQENASANFLPSVMQIKEEEEEVEYFDVQYLLEDDEILPDTTRIEQQGQTLTIQPNTNSGNQSQKHENIFSTSVGKCQPQKILRKLLPRPTEETVTGRNLTEEFISRMLSRPMATQRHKQCTKCRTFFYSNRDLKNHRLLCLAYRQNKCNWCDVHVQRRDASNLLRLHAFEHHPDVSWPECDVCGRHFVHKFLLLRHFRRCHMLAPRFECSFCHKMFKNRNHLDNHLRIHTGEKPFVCEKCGMALTTLPELRQHKNYWHNPTRNPQRKMKMRFQRI